MTNYSSPHIIATVARREIRNSLRSKGIMLTLVLVLVALVGGIMFGSHQLNSPGAAAKKTVAVSNIDPTIFEGTGFTAISVANAEAGKQMVTDGDAAAAFFLDSDTLDFIHKGTAFSELETLAQTVSQQISLYRALETVGVSPAQLAASAPMLSVTEHYLEADNDDRANRNQWNVWAALIGIVILMLALTLFANSVGSRVTEEKSSRIIELIVASVKPTDFLSGKILGNVVFGTVAMGIIIGCGAIALKVSGILGDNQFSWSIAPALLVAFVLGITFFSSLYAAAGAMVQRTEDLQSTQSPIMLLIFAVLYTPTVFFTQLDSTWMRIIAWIPPFSIGHAPLQYAAGNMTSLQFSLSMLFMFALTLIVIRASARIYTTAILYNGAPLKWLQVLKPRRK